MTDSHDGTEPTPPEQAPGGSDTTAHIPGIIEPVDRPTGDVNLSSADRATIEALRPGTALLIALRGPNSGARFLLDDEEVSTGRHPTSDIFLDDVTVSRRHAVFRRIPSGYAVTDIGSLNGTYVNGTLVDSADLQAGDEVQVGKFRLVYCPATTS